MPTTGKLYFGDIQLGNPDSYWDVLSATAAAASVNLSWAVAGGSPASYELSVDDVVTDVGGVTSITKTGLTAGVSYDFKVRPVFADGSSGGWSFPKSSGPTGFNNATGGTESTISNYNGTGQQWKVHTFASNGTFTVANAVSTFNYLVIGGGGGGGNANANGFKAGNPGAFKNITGANLSTTSYSITIGGGGGGGNQGQGAAPGSGGTTTFSGVNTSGGGGGGADGLANSPNASGTSNIQGSNKTYTDYGSGGYHYAYNGSGWGSSGGSGLVVVAYRIG